MTDKGINSLKLCCELRGDVELNEYLLVPHENVIAHISCHKAYTNKKICEQLERHAEEAAHEVQPKVLRSATVSFDWKQHCFLCGQSAVGVSGRPLQGEVSSAMTIELRDNLLKICSDRNDEWSIEVQSRLHMCSDLPAAEGIYHRSCCKAFLNVKQVIVEDISSAGRPPDPHMSKLFDQLCDRIEAADDELYTLTEMRDLMKRIGECDEVYSEKQIKQKLIEKYEDHIFFSEVCGRKNVVCFRNMASRVITNKWYAEREDSFVDESQRIVTAAAKLVKAQIREYAFSNDTYPVESEYNDAKSAKQWVPSLLKIFMENIVSTELKQVAICHSIVQAARPRSVIAPILFGLGVSLDHAFGSKWMLDLLSRNGFSVSYDEITLYKQSVVLSDTPDLPQSYPGSFTQWSGDNIDHNVNTIDGSNTFHGMGIISMTTPYSRLEAVYSRIEAVESGNFSEVPVRRLKRTKSSDLIKNRGIPILLYTSAEKSSLSLLLFGPILHLSFPYILPPTVNLHLLWSAGIVDAEHPRPNWSGFMQHVVSPPDGVFQVPLTSECCR